MMDPETIFYKYYAHIVAENPFHGFENMIEETKTQFMNIVVKCFYLSIFTFIAILIVLTLFGRCVGKKLPAQQTVVIIKQKYKIPADMNPLLNGR